MKTASFSAVKWKGEILAVNGKSQHLSSRQVDLHADEEEIRRQHKAHTVPISNSCR